MSNPENIENPLVLSDEDFLRMAEPDNAPNAVQIDEPSDISENIEDTGIDINSNVTDNDEDALELENTDDNSELGDMDSNPDTQLDEVDKNTSSKAETTNNNTTEITKDIKATGVSGDTNEPTDKSTEIDYKAAYEAVFSPFKAVGREMQVSTPEEAVRLMQMGAGYNEKMRALKPSMRIIKMLENNELLDEDKLSYLIDLDKKNPGAVNKLIKESGIDPLEIDVENDTEYTPKTYTVDDKQVELDMVLAEIEHSPTYASTMDVIGNKWDDASKKTLYENPRDIVYINEQIQSGVYEKIDNYVQNQKMLGNLNGMSDIEAYRAVGTYMAQNNLLPEIGQKSNTVIDNNATPVPLKTATEATQNPTLEKKKKAAGATRAKPSKTAELNVNPLEMSDEEFAKLAAPKI